MARNPITTQAIDTINDTVPDPLNAELNESMQHHMAIMEQFVEGLPYHYERLIEETRFFLSQSAESMLEAGKRLLIIKESEPHGKFTQAVEERLGINYNTAVKMMKAAAKYLDPKLASNLSALTDLGKTKLFELMTEDDGDLSELAEGGSIAGMTLDDIDRMTSRELRKALRESRENLDASRQLNAEKSQEINELKETKFKTIDPDIAIQKLITDFCEEHEKTLRIFIGTLPDFFQRLEEDYHRRGVSHTGLMAGLLGDIECEITSLRAQFAIPDIAKPDTSWLNGASEEDENFQLPELKTAIRSLGE